MENQIYFSIGIFQYIASDHSPPLTLLYYREVFVSNTYLFQILFIK